MIEASKMAILAWRDGGGGGQICVTSSLNGIQKLQLFYFVHFDLLFISMFAYFITERVYTVGIRIPLIIWIPDFLFWYLISKESHDWLDHLNTRPVLKWHSKSEHNWMTSHHYNICLVFGSSLSSLLSFLSQL